jgi:hypothetical protein
MTDPYRVVQSALPPSFHRGVVSYLRAHQLGDDAPHEAIPNFLRKDKVTGRAVSDLLGPNAEPDPCRHVHTNQSPYPGEWHRDDYCGQPWPAGYQFAILCYFPQATPAELGPTAIRVDGQEIVGAGPAGTCLVMRHDVEHRSTGNLLGGERFMLKYLFRAEEKN